jgi:hypothetical protein
MPIVPERQESLIPIPGGEARLPSEGFGEGFQQVAQAGLGLAAKEQERALDIAAKEKSKVDKAIGLDADFRLSRLKTDLEIKRSQLKGRDSANAIEGIENEWKLGVEEIGKGLGNDEQKAFFSNRVNHHWFGAGGLYESTLKYSDKELNQFAEDNFKAVTDLRIEDAIEKSSDPEVFAQSIAELEAISKDHFDDPAVAEDWFNDKMETIDAGIKQIKTEAAAEAKRLEAAQREEANKQLTDFQIEDALTLGEIKRRRDSLDDTDYNQWVKRYEDTIRRKEAEAKKVTKDDEGVKIDRTVERYQLTTPQEVEVYKQQILDDIQKRKLTTTTGNQYIKAAEDQLKLDTNQKESMRTVSKKLELDRQNGVYGEADSVEALAEYIKQQNALNDWVRSGKPAEEYLDRVSKVNDNNWLTRWWDTEDIFALPPERVTGEQVREEAAEVLRKEADDKRQKSRQKAIDLLNSKGKRLTPANIDFVMEQL